MVSTRGPRAATASAPAGRSPAAHRRALRLAALVLAAVGALAGLIAVVVAGSARPALAHDTPADIRITGGVKPAGERLELLLRVPMRALIEVDFPKHGRDYLTVSEADPALRNAVKLWLTDNIDVTEDGRLLAKPEVTAVRVSLPSNRAFTSFETARAHLFEPKLADDLDLYWNQQMLDVLLTYPIASDTSRFALRFGVEQFALRVDTTLRYLPPDGGVRAFEFTGNPGLLQLDPSAVDAARRFFVSGFEHILGGVDHLLFLLCLVVPFLRVGPLLVLVTSFTVAHSLSLAAAAFGFVPNALWFGPLIETLIAATIVWMALENIVFAVGRGRRGAARAGRELERRWIVTFCFGLIHGFGFSFLLVEEFQFAGTHLVTALAAFNLGVEAGQIAALVMMVPLLRLAFARLVPERIGVVIVSALVVHTAWHWMMERGDALMAFPFPALDPAFLAGLLRALLALLVIAVVLALVNMVVGRWTASMGGQWKRGRLS